MKYLSKSIIVGSQKTKNFWFNLTIEILSCWNEQNRFWSNVT